MSNTGLVKFTDERGQAVQFTAEDIKSRLCPGISDKDLAFVLGLCQAQRLNPFTKDVHIVQYGNAPASIITSKDVFTKRASANKKYQGFEAGVTYINARGEVCQREGSAVYRAAKETLVGGWCRVYVEGRKPFYDEVTLDEYSTGKSGWAKMPATMIRKVALVHCLREAFPDDFQGLYAAEEMGQAGEYAAQAASAPQNAPQRPAEAPAAIEVEAEAVELMSEEQGATLQGLCETFGQLRGKSPSEVYAALMDSRKMREAGARIDEVMTSKQADTAAAVLLGWIDKAEAMHAEQPAEPVVIEAEPITW